MFGRWLSTERKLELTGTEALDAAVRSELSGSDLETLRVVSAMTGLLGAVAYADRDFSDAEEKRLLLELGRIQGMTAEGARAIAAVLRKHLLAITSVGIPHYCRSLRELGDRELRLEVLESLLRLAVADGVIDQAEVNLLRQVATSLGLSQNDYNDAQARHRDKLASLR